MLIFFFLILKLALAGSGLKSAAFCSQASVSLPHPMKFIDSSIPWVWESVHDPVTQLVDTTIIIPSSCYFNQTKWLEVTGQYPKYGKFFSYGNKSNILVDVPPDFNDSFVLNLLGKQVNCVFHLNLKIVGSSKSLILEARRPFMGPMLARCPTVGIGQFDSMHIEIPHSLDSPGRVIRTNEFPVCKIPIYDPNKKQYNVSIITATNRDNPEQMMEWIEFHMLMGVDHFFIYNTASNTTSQRSISKVLSVYAKRGIVTEVVWPYKNCLTMGMARGRYTHFVNANTGKDDAFKPPCPISAYAAHASAYTRFRHTSKYILYIDDDEFVSLTNQLHSHEYHINVVADMVFERHPLAPSLGLMPIGMNACPVRDSLAALQNGGGSSSGFIPAPAAPTGLFPSNASEMVEKEMTLPRVFTKRYGRIGKNHEYKQLFRTDRVALFSVHYLSLLEANTSTNSFGVEPFFIHLQHGAILHYQTPSHESGDPFAHTDRYLPITNIPYVLDCLEAVDMKVGFSVLTPLGGGTYSQKVLNHLLPQHIYEKLKMNYKQSQKALLLL